MRFWGAYSELYGVVQEINASVSKRGGKWAVKIKCFVALPQIDDTDDRIRSISEYKTGLMTPQHARHGGRGSGVKKRYWKYVF